MVVMQAESEIAAINMVYGGAATGKSLYDLIVKPGRQSQAGRHILYSRRRAARTHNQLHARWPRTGHHTTLAERLFSGLQGGGHGDYHLIVLAPASVQEMADFVGLGFELAYKYRNPVMMLADGVVGQMMERVKLPAPRPRRTDEEIARQCPWAVTGRTGGRKPNIMTTLELVPQAMEEHNLHLQEKYRLIEQNETRAEEHFTDDAEYLIVAFGCVARICHKAVEDARAQGIKVGLLRPITLWPYPAEGDKEAEPSGQGHTCR